MIVTTPFIILDIHPCRENAAVLRGVSPDYGKISLMLYRSQSASGSVADKFREVEVEFKDDTPKEIRTADRVEYLTGFDGVAENVKSFAMANRIGTFLLKNMPENLPQPYTYDSLRSVLSHLADNGNERAWSLEQCAVVIKCAYLYESGLLPEGCTDKQSEFLENLVAAGIDNSDLPACSPQYWHQLNSWLNSLLDYQNLYH